VADAGFGARAAGGSPDDHVITSVETRPFTFLTSTTADVEGHGHPGPTRESTKVVLRIATRGGAEGYAFDANPATAAVVRGLLVGRGAFEREAIWRDLRRLQRIHRRDLLDEDVATVDQALWDLMGRSLGLPVHQLLGSFRDRVPAYASTMCGDDLPDGLGSPEAYAEFAAQCQAMGYRALKLHTWMPPYGADVDRDIEACRAVRERVGPDMPLMLDPHHDYSREEALYLGRALEELDFHWMEEPMSEASVSSYIWLTEQLDLTIVGPESVEGMNLARAEWIVAGAADVSRIGVWRAGITGAMKTVHLCESFGVRLEMHGGGAGTLQVLGAMGIPGEYYERGLLHPAVSYDDATPWLLRQVDPLTPEGDILIPTGPGLGEEIDWSYIDTHATAGWS
jgi:L-alanine-DL-glutamate epimerase-like enolase superfamily enzyme